MHSALDCCRAGCLFYRRCGESFYLPWNTSVIAIAEGGGTEIGRLRGVGAYLWPTVSS